MKQLKNQYQQYLKYYLPLILIVSFVCISGLHAQTLKLLPANDPNIVFRGVLYPIKTDTSVILNRHSLDFFTKTVGYFAIPAGRTQTGIVVSFKTASPTVNVNFTKRTDSDLIELVFAVYRNKVFLGNYTSLKLNLFSSSTTPTNWDIVLPIRYGVNFNGVEIENSYSLLPVEPENKKTYIAIGNSISHGTGQTQIASDGTYPYVLAETMGWRLYNLAVSGSFITPLIADQTTALQADVISILWGFNDWRWGRKIVADVIPRYKTLLTKLREYHPNASIYCIMATVTTSVLTDPTNTIDSLRNTQRRAVLELIAAGDKRLIIVEGGNMTATTDLVDGVHFNTAGAKKFGESLVTFVKQTEATTGIEKSICRETNKIKVLVSDSRIQLLNSEVGAIIRIYNCSGILIEERNATVPEEIFCFTTRGVYIIKTTSSSVKVII